MSDYLLKVEAEAKQLRAEVSRLTAELAEANNALSEIISSKDSRYAALWTKFDDLRKEIAELRAQEPVAYCDKDGQLWREQNDPDDKPLYARQAPAAQAVPDGWQLVPKEPTPSMMKAGALARHSAACDGGYSIVGGPAAEPCYRSMLAAAPTYKGEQK